MTREEGGVHQIAAIAAKLTQPQLDMLYFPSGYSDPNTVRAMRRKGLVVACKRTELGDAVRAFLSTRSESSL